MSWSDPVAGRRALLAALAGGGLAAAGTFAGCGFELRRPPRLAFASIALAGFAPRSPLAEELRRQLAQQVQVQDDPARAEVVLQSLLDVREKSVVASTSAAQVREFEIRVRLHFSARTPDGRELIPPIELLREEDLSYSENAALAKQFEEAELYRDMENDIVIQVMRRLAAIRL
jgi:LPS-assembly lipoprotein